MADIYIKQADAVKVLWEDTSLGAFCKRGVANAEKSCLKIIDGIKAIPPADVRPVVYCKDCKWYRESELLAPNRFCFRLKDKNGMPIGYNFADMDFCSRGERRGADMRAEE